MSEVYTEALTAGDGPTKECTKDTSTVSLVQKRSVYTTPSIPIIKNPSIPKTFGPESLRRWRVMTSW